MNTIVLVPAYGRDYKSEVALMKDWKAGKDFKVASLKWMGAYTSSNELDTLRAEGYTHIEFRFNKLNDLHILEISA